MIDDAHDRPPGASDAVIEAVGKVSEALEWIERARGNLYNFHHLIGRADFLMEEGAELLEKCDERELGQRIRDEVIGRNVLDGRWTFQVVEEFDDLYYRAVQQAEEDVRQTVTGGKRHLYEAQLKEDRRTRNRPGHESRPPGRHIDERAVADAD